MNITIWDLDYYYAKASPNSDAMRVSSYHKQLGDIVNFVATSDDIDRPYDYYYIFKNDKNLPEPPMKFLLDKKRVRWWGKGVPANRIKWRMTDRILGCRPDYLLYPSVTATTATKIDRAERVQFFNYKAEPLEWVQTWTNTFKNKVVIVTDSTMWFASDENVIKALEFLCDCRNVVFLEPIWIQKITGNKLIRSLFFKLKIANINNSVQWVPATKIEIEDTMKFLTDFKISQKTKTIGKITFDYRDKKIDHWQSKQQAFDDFAEIRKWTIYARAHRIPFIIRMPATRYETPYFELFENLAEWTKTGASRSCWLEWITRRYGHLKDKEDFIFYWNHPEKWNEVFRDLLLQTYKYPDFMLQGLGIKSPTSGYSDVDIPWTRWKEEFKNEI